MFFTLYDKSFNAIGRTRSTYPATSWKLIRNAYAFDTLNIEGMGVYDADNAVYVSLSDDRGKILATFLAGVPETANNITKINAIDPRKVLDTEALIDFTLLNGNPYLHRLYDYLIARALVGYTQSTTTNKVLTYTGGYPFSAINVDTSEVHAKTYDTKLLSAETAPGNVWDTIQSVCALTDTCVLADIDVLSNTLTIKVVRVVNSIAFNLKDFGETTTKLKSTYTNRALCFNETYTESAEYYLTKDNQIVQNAPTSPRLNVPIVTKVFTSSELSAAVADGIKELAKNRYMTNVEVNVSNSPLSYIFKDIDFSYLGTIYNYKRDTPTAYLVLPLMEISEDSKGNKKLTFGRLERYWWQRR